MERGEAVPFILIDETVSNKDVEYSFKIHPKAHQVFNSEQVKNKKVVIAAVAGPQRTGKSFLANRLLKRMTGFAIGPSTMPCTKGLWIWGEPIPISQDTVLIIMDTEGLNSVQRDVNVDMKIFSLSILLSSVFIYNSLGHIDQKALENMSYVLRVSENIKISSDNDSEGEIAKYFPYFYWVLRDFSLDLKGMSEGQYLNESLKPISQNEQDPRNQIRSKIRKLFAQRRCDCFPRPVNQQDKLAHIQSLQFDALRQNFKSKMQSFQRTFYSNLPPKTINNKPITGSIYLNLAYEYVNAMNNGRIPKIKNSLQSVIASECRKVCDSYKNNFKNAMDNFMKPELMPIDQAEIDKKYREWIAMLEQKLNQKFQIWGDVSIVQETKNKLFEDLAKDLQDRKRQNSKMAEVAASKSIIKLFDSIQLPQLKSSQMITINLVQTKKQQFMKKILEYMQTNKGSTKYQVFSKKFPDTIFDYFGKLVAKIKGVYSDELIKLQQQTDNQLAEVQSLKRIMKMQNQTFLQKQREVQAITLSRDLFQRQLKTLQELSKFQKQSEKMSKNDIKKTVQDLKRQTLQLQNSNEQLQSMNQRLKAEVANLKLRPQAPTEVKTNNSTEHNDELQNLPTQLAYTLIQLRGKLSVMNQFYDKKVKDQTLDEYMNRQIQQARNEKHQTIQKIKEECRNKLEQQRNNIEKKTQNYEKQLSLINTHLDYIKNQNINLRKQSADNPDREKKTKELMMWKKKCQQTMKFKQNHLNSEIAINSEKQRQIEKMKKEQDQITGKLALISAEKANLDSFKNSFSYVLRECLNFALNRPNKLKHAIKSLDDDEQKILIKTLRDVGLQI